MNVSGTTGNYITFKANGEDEVIIDGAGLSDYALMEIYDVDHIALESLRFMNSEQLDAFGILIEGACDHIRIEDCDISNINFSTDPNAVITNITNAQALIVYGTQATHAITDLEIIDNEKFNCRLGFSEGLAVNGNVDGFIVSENEVHDITNIDINIIGHDGTCSDPLLDQARNGVITDNETYRCLSPYATSAGIYVDGGTNLVIERNHVFENQWGIEIGCENPGKTTDNIVVRNNFIYGNTASGIVCGGYEFPTSRAVTNSVISNNTLYGNDTENDYSGELYLSYNEGLTVTNNIFFATNSQAVMMSDENLATQSVNVNMYNNLWYHPVGEGCIEFTFEGSSYSTLSDFQTATGFGNASVFTNPYITSTVTNPDLHLAANSPAIDFGNSTFTNVGDNDIDNGARIFGSAIDLGADEFGSMSTGIVAQTFLELKVAPNPAQDFIHIQGDYSTNSVIKFYAIDGKLVKTVYIENKQSISSAFLESGIYLLHLVEADGTMYRTKLILEK